MLLVASNDTDPRVGAVAATLARHLGTTVANASSVDPGGSDAVVCAAVGIQVADDAMLSAALSRPGGSVVALGPHSTSEVLVDGPVVVPFDGSRNSTSIFPTARAWAHRLDVPIVLAHMWQPLDALDHGSEIFGAVRDALAALGPSARFEPIRTAYPAGAIRELAHELDASLVAMSPLGADAQSGEIIGHVAARVVRECSCPVLLQRPIDVHTD